MAFKDLGLIVGQRLWQAVAGVVTILFVVRFLTAEEQGWYYTFVSVAALYSLFEMGLAAALVQTSAHFFVGLRWQADGNVQGEAATAFKSFVAKGFRVYLWIAAGFIIVALTFGIAYFSTKPSASIGASWIYPWLVVVLATAASMIALPFFAVVEGSGALTEVYGVRLFQGMLGSITCWMVLADGGALWAAAAVPGMAALVAGIWLLARRTTLAAMALKPPIASDFNWRFEIWPLQWRIGISWVSAFLMSQLCTPILFYFQDARVAGQMGLSLTVAHMLGILAQSAFVRSVVPMSRAVAHRDWGGLGAIFRKNLMILIAGYCLGAALVVGGYRILADSPYIERVLPIEQMAGLLVFVFFYQVIGAFATHIRAFRREPLAWISALGAGLILLGSLATARHYSATGVIGTMVFVQLCLVFPTSYWVWKQNVARWSTG